jgi:hypothetical protein
VARGGARRAQLATGSAVRVGPLGTCIVWMAVTVDAPSAETEDSMPSPQGAGRAGVVAAGTNYPSSCAVEVAV